MTQQNSKLVMMRFDPRAGWVTPTEEHIHVEEGANAQRAPVKPEPSLNDEFTAFRAKKELADPAIETLNELGQSILEVFQSLKLEDPRLEAWDQVNATIGKISEKINEQKELTQRLHEVAIDLENLRNLASEFVNHAYQNEIEIHATSKVRVQIAESLNQRIKNALKP